MNITSWKNSLSRFLGKSFPSEEANDSHVSSSSSSINGHKRRRDDSNHGEHDGGAGTASERGDTERGQEEYRNQTTACEGCMTLWTSPDESVRWSSLFAYCWQVAAAGGICVILIPDRRMCASGEDSADIRYLSGASGNYATPLELPLPYLRKKNSTEIETTEYLTYPRILERIQLRYVSSLKEIVDYASHLHRYPDEFNYPDTIVFHNVHLLLSRNTNQNLETDNLEYKRKWCFFMGIVRHVLRIPSLKGNLESASISAKYKRNKARTKPQQPLLGKGTHIIVSLDSDVAEKENRCATFRCLSHCAISTTYPLEIIGEYVDAIVGISERPDLDTTDRPGILRTNDFEVYKELESCVSVKRYPEGIWWELHTTEGSLDIIRVCASREPESLYIPTILEGQSIFDANSVSLFTGYTRPEENTRFRTREDWQIESISRVIFPRNRKKEPTDTGV